MSDPVLDEARLAAIQAAADKVKGVTGGKYQSACIESAKNVPELLAHVGVLQADNQRLREREAPHCPTCSCGCTCGYGGFHEPENPRCRLNDGGV